MSIARLTVALADRYRIVGDIGAGTARSRRQQNGV